MQFLSRSRLQLQNRTCKPGAIFSAICRRDIARVSSMFETWCNFGATKIASNCRDQNRLCKRAFRDQSEAKRSARFAGWMSHLVTVTSSLVVILPISQRYSYIRLTSLGTVFVQKIKMHNFLIRKKSRKDYFIVIEWSNRHTWMCITTPSVFLQTVRWNMSKRIAEGKGCRDNFPAEMNSV